MSQLPVYLLAGGRSRRFGATDKARAIIGEQPLLLHAAAELDFAASRIAAVAERPAKYDDLGVRTIGDSGANNGPLDGLRAALDDLRDDETWLLLSGCDLVGLRRSWITQLLDAADSASRAVAFRGQRWQPLPGLYHRSLKENVAEQLVAEGSLWRLLEQVKASARPLPADWSHATIDVNTEEALAAAGQRRSAS